MAVCDRWWLALGDPALLRAEDVLPESWGIVACRGRGLTVLREPQPLPAPVQSGQMLASVLAASLRAHGLCRGLAAVESATRHGRVLDRLRTSHAADRNRAFDLGIEEGRRQAAWPVGTDREKATT